MLIKDIKCDIRVLLIYLSLQWESGGPCRYF